MWELCWWKENQLVASLSTHQLQFNTIQYIAMQSNFAVIEQRQYSVACALYRDCQSKLNKWVQLW